MLPKPESCRSCPWYGDGQGYCPDEIPEGCQVVLLAQNPGETEEFQGRPLIGTTGQIMRQQFVSRHLAGRRVGYANVVKCRRQGEGGRRSNELPRLWTSEWRAVMAACRPALEATLARLNEDAIVVPMGEHAIAVMTELMAPGRKKPPVLHLRGTLVGDACA